MKKNLLIAAMATLVAASSYGQGFIQWQGYFHGVGNNYTTPGTITYNAGLDVELLFAAASTVPLVDGIATSSTASTVYTISQAWADINNGQFSGVAGTNSTTALIGDAATGGFTYNASAAYNAGLTGGTTYTMYEIAWNTGGGLYLTAAAAAAAGEFVGWSAPFQYTPTTSGNPAPVQMGSSGVIPSFDVGGTATPEPGTMALAALGGASLLMFRRKK